MKISDGERRKGGACVCAGGELVNKWEHLAIVTRLVSSGSDRDLPPPGVKEQMGAELRKGERPCW